MIDLLNGDRIKKGVMYDLIINRNLYPISFNGDNGNKLYLCYSKTYQENGKYFEEISDPDLIKILLKAYKLNVDGRLLDGEGRPKEIKDSGFINFMKSEYGIDLTEGCKGVEFDDSPEPL